MMKAVMYVQDYLYVGRPIPNHSNPFLQSSCAQIQCRKWSQSMNMSLYWDKTGAEQTELNCSHMDGVVRVGWAHRSDSEHIFLCCNLSPGL